MCVHEEQLVKETRELFDVDETILFWVGPWLALGRYVTNHCPSVFLFLLSFQDDMDFFWLVFQPWTTPNSTTAGARSRIRLPTSPPHAHAHRRAVATRVLAPPLWNACRWPQSRKGPNRICICTQTIALLRKSKARGQRRTRNVNLPT